MRQTLPPLPGFSEDLLEEGPRFYPSFGHIQHMIQTLLAGIANPAKLMAHPSVFRIFYG